MTTALQVDSPANDAALSRTLAAFEISETTSHLVEARVVGRIRSDGSACGAVLRACVSHHNGAVTVSDEAITYRSARCPTPSLVAVRDGVELVMPRVDGDATWRATIDSLGTI